MFQLDANSTLLHFKTSSAARVHCYWPLHRLQKACEIFEDDILRGTRIGVSNEKVTRGTTICDLPLAGIFQTSSRNRKTFSEGIPAIVQCIPRRDRKG